MKENRLKWKTFDDSGISEDEEILDFTKINLQQQRIRTFKVSYFV